MAQALHFEFADGVKYKKLSHTSVNGWKTISVLALPALAATLLCGLAI